MVRCRVRYACVVVVGLITFTFVALPAFAATFPPHVLGFTIRLFCRFTLLYVLALRLPIRYVAVG